MIAFWQERELMKINRSELRSEPGKWKIENDDDIYNGELLFNEEKHICVLELTLPASATELLPTFEHTGDIPIIQGELFSGAKVVLYKCKTGTLHSNVGANAIQPIYCEYAFWGLSVQCIDELVFKGVSIDFGDVLSWYDICSFSTVMETDYRGVHWKNKPAITLNEGSNLEISFVPLIHIKGIVYDRTSTLEQSVAVRLKYSDVVPWEVIIKDIKKIQYLIGIGIGHRAEIGSLRFHHESLKYDFPDKSTHYIDASVLLCDNNDTPTKKAQPYDCLFQLQDFINLPDAYNNWLNIYDKLEPVLDLQFAVYKGVGTPENVFLCLTQALETFHSRFMSNSVSDYKRRVNEIINSINDDSSRLRWGSFLMDEKQANAKHIYLRSRLADLIYAEGSLPFLTLASSTYIQKIVDTRNYYTHYSDDKKGLTFQNEELSQESWNLLLLLQYHILRQLGFDNSFIVQKLKHPYR